ncbi:MAG TPA: hypothetical protein VNF71_05160 [Acidimicrobiales bacterium]|nr:hypothetical protein [Acidimicrobiales bacterium]
MHPIERLRHVARVSGADPALVASEAAGALASMASIEPAGLVPACRRLIERHVTSGPVWWMCARVLSAADPAAGARQAASDLDADRTDRVLAGELPEGATVTVVGWPDATAAALRSRGDVEVLVLDAGGEGGVLARRLRDGGSECDLVPDRGVGPAAAVSDVVIVEALMASTAGLLAPPGSLPAAAVAAHFGVPVWAVVATGRLLPAGLWDAALARLDGSGDEPWDRAAELVPVGLVTQVITADGPSTPEDGLADASCPVAPELLRPAG